MTFPPVLTDAFRLRQLLLDMCKSGRLDRDQIADARLAIRHLTLAGDPDTEGDTFERFTATEWIDGHTKLWMRRLTVFDARRRGDLSSDDENTLTLALLFTESALGTSRAYPAVFEVSQPI
jgi:hypothetical protein